MKELYNKNASKKPTNLSINSDLLNKARALNINLSSTLEQVLKQRIKEAESKNWAKENKAAIKAYNDFVDEHGCVGDEFRDM